jgi:hypothetical protein
VDGSVHLSGGNWSFAPVSLVLLMAGIKIWRATMAINAMVANNPSGDAFQM